MALGIETLKKASLLGIQLGKAVETSVKDGFTLADLSNFILPLSQLPALLQDKALMVAEFKDLDATERQELLDYVSANLDLENDKLEATIEKGLAVIVSVLDLVTHLKAEPETPVVE